MGSRSKGLADPGAREVALDPGWLPHTYDVGGSMLTFVQVPRESRPQLMFLSDEHLKTDFPKLAFSASDVAAAAREARQAPLHFIFHTALCGSTLMLKALEIAGRSQGLKEPDVLINLANRLIRSDDPANRERLHLVLRLLARPFDQGEVTIVKPSNFANRLALPALQSRADSRAVLLYSDVGTLLRSILRRGMWGRIWGRKLFRSAANWTSLDFGYSEEEIFQLTDLQALGLGWLMQMHEFAQLARHLGERVLIINSSDFLADPAATISDIARLFELGLDEQSIAEITRGPIFRHHSKFTDQEYGPDQRATDQNAAEAANRDEVEMVVKWVETVAAHMNVDLDPASTFLERAL